ncbi:MAG: stage V sporulation protein AD [Ruminococcus sp.]|nr:stage V sporulation protein AD [Ruminococcus sp.]
MSKKLSSRSMVFTTPPNIKSYSSTVGKEEGDGNLSEYFDVIEEDSHFGQDSWEKAESTMQGQTIERAIQKANLSTEDIDFMFSGDLINQCTSTTYGIRDLEIPFFGIYGACSTMTEGILLASMNMDNSLADNIVCATSSHFSTAERQFRFPISYGGQRTPTAQWTCTASGAVVVSHEKKPPYIVGGCIGKIVDLGITDVNNMGSAMAPSAADTIKTYLNDTGYKPSDFDNIVTGDLGIVGSKLLIELLQKDNIDISTQHADCGVMMFDIDRQDKHAGGSGCGCSASILCAYWLPKIQTGELKNVLFMSTGALMSTMLLQQGESIPGIAHLIHLSHDII